MATIRHRSELSGRKGVFMAAFSFLVALHQFDNISLAVVAPHYLSRDYLRTHRRVSAHFTIVCK